MYNKNSNSSRSNNNNNNYYYYYYYYNNNNKIRIYVLYRFASIIRFAARQLLADIRPEYVPFHSNLIL